MNNNGENDNRFQAAAAEVLHEIIRAGIVGLIHDSGGECYSFFSPTASMMPPASAMALRTGSNCSLGRAASHLNCTCRWSSETVLLRMARTPHSTSLALSTW